jgi:TRAP-type C4-dicarboxylate transport system substrate-binding protein
VKGATDDHFQRAAEVEAKAIDQLQKQGVTVAECDRAVFRERVSPMWGRFAEKTPGAKDLLEAVRQTEKA